MVTGKHAATSQGIPDMHYKKRVLAQVPNARPVVLHRYPDMEPKYVAIFNGPGGTKPLDPGYDRDEHDNGWGGEKQLHNAAWRAAYYYLVRKKNEATV